MLRTVLCSTLALVAGSAVVAYADAKDDVTQAAQKLSDASNYTWKITTEMNGGGGGGGRGFGGGPIEGKTEKDGYTVVTITFGDNSRQFVMKGDKMVFQNRDGDWQTPEEAQAAQDQNGGGNQGRRGGMMGRMQNMLKGPGSAVADLVSKTQDLHTAADGAIVGDLTQEGAESLLSFGGRRPRNANNANGNGNGNGNDNGNGNANRPRRQITNAKGTVKFWITDGVLTRYESHLTGTTTNRDGDNVDIDRTSTVEISNVGSTKVEVPADAKQKLG